MDYPVWWIPSLSAALPVAIIALVHVFVAHFAVGGGLFVVMAERVGLKSGSPAILGYVKRHSLFFMLLTLVFGGLTGVGIWLVIGAASPGATNMLIHTFVFGWATEWVFFIGEIVAILIYYYKFGQMRDKEHQIIGWLYFAFGWLSLFMINGIIGFMLTPGGWLETGDFWQGFFNPSFWPSLVFRTAISIMIAGFFGYLTAIRIQDVEARERMVRFCTWFSAAPFLVLVLSGFWYVMALPQAQFAMVMEQSQEIPFFLKSFAVLTPLIFLGALALAFVVPQRNRTLLAWVLLLLAFAHLSAFEWTREAGRRPYLIWDTMYSNSVMKADVEELTEKGFLSKAKWVRAREVTDENRLLVGEDLFRLQCSTCHSIGGAMLDILPLTAKYGQFGLEAQLTGQGAMSPYMPPFVGNEVERSALAAYIVEKLHGKTSDTSEPELAEAEVPAPGFNAEENEYILLVWSSTGMHTFSDADGVLSIQPPGNDIYAQLLLRGPMPEFVTEGVKITYAIREGFENPAAQLKIWDFMKPLYGIDIAPSKGLDGRGLEGELHVDEDLRVWKATQVPVSPYDAEGGFMPYPLLKIEARDAESGDLLAETYAVAPASTEMGCRTCHGGGWRLPKDAPVAGMVDDTALDILAMHDKRSKTKLLDKARHGEPQACQSCHADSSVPQKRGDAKLLNLSAAIHGFHAPYLEGRGYEACNTCHSGGEEGATRMLRGLHNGMMQTCTECHGTLSEHAQALLKAEQGKAGAARLLSVIKPGETPLEEIEPRRPWIEEPDCAGCHDLENGEGVQAASAFNKWSQDGAKGLFRMRRDNLDAMMCAACHNSPHALYPATNPYAEGLDSIQPMQYQGENRPIGGASCAPCHVEEDMGDFPHHPKP